MNASSGIIIMFVIVTGKQGGTGEQVSLSLSLSLFACQSSERIGEGKKKKSQTEIGPLCIMQPCLFPRSCSISETHGHEGRLGEKRQRGDHVQGHLTGTSPACNPCVCECL